MSGVYGINEEKLRATFRKCGGFKYNQTDFKVLKVGKPRPLRGECKTDVYILAQSAKGTQEFKLSVKQRNADFLENKISLERAKEIFGPNAKSIIAASTRNLQNIFLSENLVFFDRKNQTEAKCITLGWKFELFNKLSGGKSGLMALNISQKADVYSGINASPEKRNCRVEDKFIPDSGVANFILEVDSTIVDDADFYAQKFKPISEFVLDKNVYFACKALNYRAEKDKWDSDRPLAVYVKWTLASNRLNGEIVFDNPLEVKGNEVGYNVRKILGQLGVNRTNFQNLQQVLDPSVKFWKEV